MKIQSIIRRIKGHDVKIDDKVYSFKPSNDYTAIVKEKKHQAVFLGIPEGYVVLEGNIDQTTLALIPTKQANAVRVVTPAADFSTSTLGLLGADGDTDDDTGVETTDPEVDVPETEEQLPPASETNSPISDTNTAENEQSAAETDTNTEKNEQTSVEPEGIESDQPAAEVIASENLNEPVEDKPATRKSTPRKSNKNKG